MNRWNNEPRHCGRHEMENLMGRVRYLWERNDEFKKKIETLESQRQELEGQRVQTPARGNNCVIRSRN